MSLWKNLQDLARLSTRVELLELEMKRFRLDADEMYERYRKMSSRIAKRVGTIEQHEQSEEVGPAASALSGNNHGPGLSDHQKQIQQQILRRRAGMA